MSLQYIKLSGDEKNYGEKKLLQSRLDLISNLKHLREYKKIRREEIVLKIALKNKVKEVQDLLDSFRSLLPKVKLQKESSMEKEIDIVAKETKEISTLDQELEEIRNKLERLH